MSDSTEMDSTKVAVVDSSEVKTPIKKEITETDSSELSTTPQVVEEFIDSVNIGRKGSHKLYIQKIATDSMVIAKVQLFEKTGQRWNQTQEIITKSNLISGLNVKLSDFNNDGFKDLTFSSIIAVRGANEVNHLLIFDKKTRQLRMIHNANQFPNIRYNKELDCVDSWTVTAGTTTSFLKIEKDSLREFAYVSLSHGIRTIATFDRKGNRTSFKETPMNNEAHYIRFSNYNPLKELKEE